MLDHQGSQVLLVVPDFQDLQDPMDLLVKQVREVPRVQQVTLEHQALMVVSDHQEILVHLVQVVKLAPRAHQDLVVVPAQGVSQDREASQGLQAHLGRQEKQVDLEWLDRQALKDKPARLVRVVFKDQLEISDHRELQGREDSRDHEVSQVHLDKLDLPDQTESLDHQARLELKVQRGKLGNQEARVVLGSKDQQDQQEMLDLRVNLAIKVRQVTLGRRVNKGPEEIQELEVPLDLLVTQANKEL